ncbi:MAG: hypothetical protein K9G41_04325 [Flavobacteriales bacterium]|nr:hypothetical protein [Flavobacteriales bacterium]
MNDRLFELISKMTRTEKSHFRKFGFKSLHGGKAEMELFEIIRDGQRKKVSNLESYVKESYAKTKRNDLIRMRARLFDSLVISVSDHQRNKHDIHHFSSILLHGRVLSEKGLFKDARKTLRKGLQMAREQQKPQWEAILAKEMSFIETRQGTHADILKTIDLQLTSLRHSEQLTQLARCYELAFHTQRTMGLKREDKELMAIKLKEIEHVADQIDLKACLPAAHFNRIMIRQIIAHTLTDAESALRHTEEAFQFVRNYPEMSIGRPQLPVALLSNLMNDGLSSNQFQYYYEYIETLRSWPTADLTVKRFAAGQLFRTESNAALHFGEFHRWKEFMHQLSNLSVDHLLPHVRWALMGQLVHMMYADSAIRTCIKETNKLLHEIKINQRQDLTTNLELLLAVCHYKLENFSTAAQILDSAQSRLSLQNQFSESEKLVMTTLKKLISSPEFERKEIVRFAAAKLSKHNLRPIGFFDPFVWLQAEAEGKTYIEAYKVIHRINVV